MSDEKKPSHVTSAKNQWELNKKAKKRIRIAGGKIEVYEAKEPVQDLETTIAGAWKESIAFAQPGQMIEGHGVFIGTWTPKDSEGKSLSQTFNVFAAPQDLQDTPGSKESCSYIDAVKHIAGLKNWNGFDGANYATDKELIQALKDGSYKGGWVIPPLELLSGMNAACLQVQPDNLYAHKDKGALKNSFVKEAIAGVHGSGYADRYWSSTERKPANPKPADEIYMYSFSLSQGTYFISAKNYSWQSCRPVRLEPRP